jgi:hypothetical protein
VAKGAQKVSDVTLRDYIERILVEHEKTHAIEHAQVKLAADTIGARVDGLNELRQEYTSDRGLFVTKDYVQQLMEQAAERNITRDQKAEQLANELEEKTQLIADAVDKRIKPLETFHSRAALVGSALVFIGGIVGALVIKALGG